MRIEPTFKANTQLAEARQPSMRSLNHQAMPTKLLATFNASTGNPGLNASSSKVVATTAVVVAFVGV